jgi:diguanylate cyclase (GGDEF)-like protein
VQFSTPLPDAPTADAPAPPAAPEAGAYAQVLEQGFPLLRFPPQQEAHYLRDKAAERLGLLRTGAMLVAMLSSLMLVTDWLVVPDQLHLAVQLRLLFFTPLSVAWVLMLPRMDERMRERSVLVMSTIGACTCIVLCLKSRTGLGPPYLVSLSMILLFNGGVIRMRFWVATRVAAMMLALFAAAALAVRDPPVVVLMSMSVVMVATAVFTLFHTYWQEHEDRGTWLLQQQEQSLLDELGRANARLDRLSRFDPLTGLANRRHLDEFLLQAWERARRDGRAVSLLAIDVDHFKLYNDHYGHPAGDVCLKQVADALKTQLRMPVDLVARAGGEEFVAVLGDAGLPAALAAAERVRAGIAQLALAHAASPVCDHVTVSVGAATMRANAPGASPDALMAAADAALYRAKAGGRNAVAGPQTPA